MRSRWMIFAGAVAAVAIVGIAVALMTSARHSNARAPTPSVVGPATATTDAETGEGSPSTQSTSPATSTAAQEPNVPAGPAPLRALESYWADIRTHDFSGAYRYLAPAAIGVSENQFVANEQAAQVGTVRFNGTVVSRSGMGATVEVTTLVTHDAQFGCRTWTGSYTMEEMGGAWRIQRAKLSPRSCSG